MLRNRAVALLLCCLASPIVSGLGLGPLEATSALNEPFEGRIELLGAEAADFDALTVGLAGEEQFVRAGIERHPVLFQLRFTVDGDAPGKDYISITSKDPVREPFLNFLLELNWTNGRLLREYTVLLDPPLYDPNKRRLAATPAAPTTAAGAAPTSPAPLASVPPSSTGYAGGTTIGPVQAHDTLWSLASAHRPNAAVSVQQMMLALLRENPDAFSQGNINLLRRGAVLRLPDAATIDAIASDEAYAEVRRQHEVWQEYRQQIGAAPAPQPLGAVAEPAPAEVPSEPAAEPAADARLELVAPGGTDGGGTPGEGGAGSSELLRNEAMDAQTREAAELKDKLAEAEEIIDLLQRQVNIKDEELAALQARMAELGIEHGDLAAAPAEPSTEAATEAPATPAPAADEGSALPEDSATATDEPETTAAAEPEAEPEIEFDDSTVAESETTPPVESEPAVAEEAVLEVGEPTPATPGFPANLIPAGLAEAVPGGALTLLAVAALVILGLFAGVAQFLIKARNRGEVAMPAVGRRAPASDDKTITAATASAAASEDVTALDDDEATTEVPSFDPNATVEAEAESGTGSSAPAGDPLEEVNVYLAYERFDQAEELVKRVIGQYPNRHEYKLRLLEVYYSANDRVSYEGAARELLDAVGADDTLWVSAVAMWTEMSPDRALFEEGAAAEPAPAPDAGKAFVDITGDADEPRVGESTIAHAPGGREAAGLDFDLGGGDTGASDMLDLTASADISDLLDATTTVDRDAGVLDLTSGDGAGLFDISGTGAGADDLLDLTGGGLLDVTGGDSPGITSGSDLLDVTKTGDVSQFEDRDLLNVTSPGLRGHDEITTDVLGEEQPGSGTGGVDFDISDTVAPAFAAQGDADDEPGILDITGGGMGLSDDALEFDIGGLDGVGETSEAPTIEAGPVGGAAGLDLDLTAGGDGGGELDFDITMGAEELGAGLATDGSDGEEIEITLSAPDGGELAGELSLQGPGLDELALDAGGLEVQDGDGDFDFSLEGTSEMDALAADDTLDMAAVGTSNDEILNAGDEASLDDLATELDAALELPGGEELQLDIEGIDEAHTSTMSLDLADFDTGLEQGEKTVVMPGSARGDRDGDEADTKLNLAKAYIELGDTDGARSILDEVVAEGNAAQQTEARSLLGQLGA